MAFKDKFFFITGVLLILGLLSCDNSPSDAEPEESDFPPSVDITAPSSSTTYWTDKSVPCVHNQSDYADKTTWLVGEGADAEEVSCTGDELDSQLPEGEHTVTARITEDDKAVEQSVTITVKEGFAVTLKCNSDTEYFDGDAVACEATVEPEMYKEYLTITADGGDYTSGEVELTQAGETTVRAALSIDGRTEADEATVTVKPAVAGKIYPLTDQGVASQGAGFTVTLKSGGNTAKVQTSAEGNFSIKADFAAEFGAEEVTLEVAESGSFYGARAVLPGDELLALVEAQNLGFILAPKTWQIRDGKLAGESAGLKLKKAFTRADSTDLNSSFYKLRRSSGVPQYSSVFTESLPIPKAFNRAESEVEVTASDSTDFWRQTDDVTEPYVGRGSLFAAARISKVSSISDGVRVQMLADGERSSASYITGDDGYIVGGYIKLAIHNLGSYIQTHEQIHNLGFGHTDAWDGLMTYEVWDGPGEFLEQLSVNDVAHIQVYMDTFDLQFEEDVSFGVLEWMQALDIEGLPETNSSQAKVVGKRFDTYHYEAIECRIH